MGLEGKKLTSFVATLVTWLIGVVWMLPLMGIIMASIRPYTEIVGGWWRFDSLHLTLDNYWNGWNHENFPLSIGIGNSFIVAIPSTAIPLVVGSLAAYGFARFRFPGRDYLFLIVVFFFAVPLQSIAIPVFRILDTIHLLDKHLGLILVHSS